MINKDTTATVHRILTRLSSRGEQSTSVPADEVIDRNLLTGKEMILLQNALSIPNDCCCFPRGDTTLLFPILARSATRRWVQLAGGGVEVASGKTVGEYASAQEKLDLAEG
jgi:hypothetical protein